LISSSFTLNLMQQATTRTPKVFFGEKLQSVS